MSLPASTSIKIQAAVCAGGALVCLRLGAACRRARSAPQAVHTGDTGTSASGDQQPAKKAAGGLAELAYELLDAHADTAQLAGGISFDRSWAAHLDYLRALQRRGREMLARATTEELSSCRWYDPGSLDVR
jgi:hypothetical protein